jgi:hypothetical protein
MAARAKLHNWGTGVVSCTEQWRHLLCWLWSKGDLEQQDVHVQGVGKVSCKENHTLSHLLTADTSGLTSGNLCSACQVACCDAFVQIHKVLNA